MAKGRKVGTKRASPDNKTPAAQDPAANKKPKAKEHAKKPNLKKLNFTGDAPVDEHVPKRDDFEVATIFNTVYSKTLNQSNVERNNNKFYILQILQTKATPKRYFTFFRWGRVGKKGMQSLTSFGQNYAEAMAEFEDKLEAKTVQGSYIELDIVYDDEISPEEQQKKMIDDMSSSTLDKRLSELIKLLFDVKIVQKTLVEIGYDANKLPLGKLSQKNIEKAYTILKQINREIKKGNGSSFGTRLTNLNSKFFTLIPHDVGFKKMREFMLKTEEDVQKKLDLLDALSNMKIAKEIVDQSSSENNIIEANYKKLKNKINPIPKGGDTWNTIKDYIDKGACPTHNYYQLELEDCFELDRNGEARKFKEEMGNRMLLWHGSRLTNFVGILSQGLRIAPPEAPVTGYMFGKGVYFADMVTKSANYCHSNLSDNIGLLLICEVALGDTNDLLHSDYNAGNLPQGKDSTKGCGGFAPDPENYVELDGVTLPMGPGKDTNNQGSLYYNEYIVYDTAQIKMKYLCKCRFNTVTRF